ncbi:hypothetical protein VPH35_093583 [Triticum aestivum]
MDLSTAPVVDARFCSPDATAFTVARTPGRWSRRDLTVTDARGAAVMQAEASGFGFHRHSLLLDAASRCPLLTVKRRPSLFATGRRWDAFRGHSTSPTELLFAAVAMPALFGRGDVHVYLGRGGPSDRHPDFVVVRRGHYGRESAVSHAGATVARVNRKPGLFQPLEYDVSVNGGIDHAFVVALAVILDEIHRDDNRQ